ncbi:MAG TPA: periplasmic polysaccharide biosynthesis/export protein [Nitrospirae bacterium]|nr:periplasmic polysaccharide biosynthesis/export protein [Nitrospirota bacterium]
MVLYRKLIPVPFGVALAFVLATVLAIMPAQCDASDYIIGEGDVLKIMVYGHSDLTTVERVSGNGMINFPLLGQLSIAGLAVSEISIRISSLLADGYIVDPQVSVFIEEFRSQKAVIMGEVMKPGLYKLKGRTSFLELVSMAGGLTRDAGDTALVKRKSRRAKGEEEIATIDLVRLIKEGDTSLDVPVLEGDSIYVAKAGLIFVTGEVKRPDAYKYEDNTSIIKAITMAGGFTDKASAGRVKIIRKVDGKEQIVDNVNMDDPVLSGDVIVIPESFF